MEAKELVDRLTKSFDIDILTEYFSAICPKFRPENQDLPEFISEDSHITEINQIGTAEYDITIKNGADNDL